MKIKKLDYRFVGTEKFKYCIDFLSAEVSTFVKSRQWCWEQWGPSHELEFYFVDDLRKDTNPKWAWMSDSVRTRLYLATDAELAWYQLKWN